MAGSTPIYGFPYPQPSDLVANYPALGQDLAEDIETVIDGLSSGALTLITTQSFSAASAVNVNNCFSATYDNYKVHIQFSASSGSTTLQFRFRAGGNNDATAGYNLRGYETRPLL